MRPPTDGDPFRFRNLMPTTPGLFPGVFVLLGALPWAGDAKARCPRRREDCPGGCPASGSDDSANTKTFVQSGTTEPGRLRRKSWWQFWR